MSVFLDTSAVYALQFKNDPHHGEALRIKERLKGEGAALHTHEWVVLESVHLVRKRLGGEASASTSQFFRTNPAVKIHFMDGTFLEEVLKAYEGRPALGMIDTASFLLMRRLSLSRVFSFDRDFAAAGFGVERA